MTTVGAGGLVRRPLVFVIAHRYDQAIIWAAEEGLSNKEWVFVYNRNTLGGQVYPMVTKIPGCELRPDIKVLELDLETASATDYEKEGFELWRKAYADQQAELAEWRAGSGH